MRRPISLWQLLNPVLLVLFIAFLAACGRAGEEAEELDPPEAIPGTSWLVTAYEDATGNLVDVLEGTEITAHFSREKPNGGRLTGSAGCNDYDAEYDFAGEYLGIGFDLATTTQNVCPEPEGIMAQEKVYLEALRAARKWVLDGYELEFTGAGDKPVVRFAYTGPYETGGDEELVVPPDGMEFGYTFDEGQEGWIAGFADLPADYDPEIYELDSEWRELPDDLGGYGVYMQGHNRSDDLFMFLKRRVDGLEAGAIYQATFRLVLASNIAPGLSGIGGSPGESVYVKVGATTIEPIVEEAADGWLRMNIDKGNQASEGEDMINTGDMANPNLTPETAGAYERMEQNSSGRDFSGHSRPRWCGLVHRRHRFRLRGNDDPLLRHDHCGAGREVGNQLMYDKTPLQTLDFHRSMLVDEERCLGYMRAIFKSVRPGDVVLDIGSGTGILSPDGMVRAANTRKGKT